MLYFFLCVIGLQIVFNLGVIGMLLWMLYDTRGDHTFKGLSLVSGIVVINIFFIIADVFFFKVLMNVL